MKPKVRAVLYARVSSDEQKKKLTVETQIAEAKKYCEREGLELVAIYRDEGVSGTVALERRKDGRRLLEDAKAKKFDLVLIWAVSRLGRLDVVSHVAKYALESLGLGLRSIMEPFDTTTPAGSFMFSVLAANSALERKHIIQNATAGLRHAAEGGRWASGPPPFGYKIVGKKLAIDEREAATVRTIFRMVADRQSTLKVIAHLNKTGQRTRTGAKWWPASVTHVIHTTAYYGVHAWGNGDKVLQDVPPIVFREVWEKAQESPTLNKKLNPGNSKRTYLLRGLVACDFCGRAMTGITTARRYRYYRCTATRRELTDAVCPGGYVPATQLENMVLGQVGYWVLDQGVLERDLEKAFASQEHQRRERESYLADLRARLVKNDRARQRLLSLYAREEMAEKDLDRAMAELRAEEHGLREQITQLEAEGPHVSLEDAIDAAKRELGKFRAVLKGIGRNKGDLTERQKRSMLEAFVDRVTVRVKKGESLGVSAAKPHARLSLRMHMKDADMPPDVIAEGSPLSITVRLPWTDRTLKAIPRDLLCRKTPPCPIASDEKGMTSVP